MAVLTSKRAGVGPAIPYGEERFENDKLYRKRGSVEKHDVAVNGLFSVT
jgi:hypothetical protein